MSSGGGFKWALLGAGVLVMLLKVVLLMRFDKSRKHTGEPGDTR